MGRSTISLLLLVVVIGGAFAFPPRDTRYDNIPQCMQPAEGGLCLAYFPSWYYNPSIGKCDTFIYGGCRGNANRFVSEKECMAQCGDFKPENKEFKLVTESDAAKPAPEKLVENDDQKVESKKDVCSLPSKMGPCRAMMKRYYSKGGKCEEFIFGGCQGNGNNFKTIEECEKTCGSESSESESNSEKQTEEKKNE